MTTRRLAGRLIDLRVMTVLEESPFRERDRPLRGDDHMVEDAHIDQRKGIPQTLSDAQICLARLS